MCQAAVHKTDVLSPQKERQVSTTQHVPGGAVPAKMERSTGGTLNCSGLVGQSRKTFLRRQLLGGGWED